MKRSRQFPYFPTLSEQQQYQEIARSIRCAGRGISSSIEAASAPPPGFTFGLILETFAPIRASTSSMIHGAQVEEDSPGATVPMVAPPMGGGEGDVPAEDFECDRGSGRDASLSVTEEDGDGVMSGPSFFSKNSVSASSSIWARSDAHIMARNTKHAGQERNGRGIKLR